MRTSASTPVYQSVSRTRTELNILTLDSVLVRRQAQFVARASPCVNQRLAQRRVHLSAQPVDVDFYQFREGVEGIIPDMFRDFSAPDNFPSLAPELLSPPQFSSRHF